MAYTSDNFIDVDGIKTHYLEAGNGDQTIVLIHGGGAGADSIGNWDGVIPRLEDDYHVIAVDMLGFGRTDKPGGDFIYSQAARTQHMIGFLKALEIKRPMLVGNSMGGCTALGVSIEAPDMVERQILMGSAGLNAAITPAMLPIVNYDFTLEGMELLVDALTGPKYVKDPDMIKRRYELANDPDTKRAYAATMGWIKEAGGLAYEEGYIVKCKVPTLVVNGKEDLVVPIENAYKFLELIENSWGHIVPHCGHWAMIEHADDFAAITRHFSTMEVH
ncbi:MAG: alpha/beta hydrolase [Pseudomonadota bacterium]